MTISHPHDGPFCQSEWPLSDEIPRFSLIRGQYLQYDAGQFQVVAFPGQWPE